MFGGSFLQADFMEITRDNNQELRVNHLVICRTLNLNIFLLLTNGICKRLMLRIATYDSKSTPSLNAEFCAHRANDQCEIRFFTDVYQQPKITTN